MGINKQDSQIITIARAFALVSIVSAHCTSVGTECSSATKFSSCFMNGFGNLGVVLFFFISGYLFEISSHKNITFLDFWKQKIISLFVPWFVSSTLVYLYVVARKGGFSFWDMLLSVIGYSSSYWYMLALVLLYLIFFYIHNRKMVVVCLIVSLLYRIPLGMYILPNNNFFTYVNPLNWIWIFALGILLSDYSFSELKIRSGVKQYNGNKYCFWFIIALVSTIALVTALAVLSCEYRIIHYKNILYPLLSSLFCISAIGISTLIVVTSKHAKLLNFVGSKSFSVYLYHELGVAGIVAKYFQLIDSPLFVILRPFVVIAITITILEIGRFIAKLVHMSSLYGICIGDRSRK